MSSPYSEIPFSLWLQVVLQKCESSHFHIIKKVTFQTQLLPLIKTDPSFILSFLLIFIFVYSTLCPREQKLYWSCLLSKKVLLIQLSVDKSL